MRASWLPGFFLVLSSLVATDALAGHRSRCGGDPFDVNSGYATRFYAGPHTGYHRGWHDSAGEHLGEHSGLHATPEEGLHWGYHRGYHGGYHYGEHSGIHGGYGDYDRGFRYRRPAFSFGFYGY